MIYLNYLSIKLKIIIHLANKAQIASLFTNKIIIIVKYLDFAYVFLKKLI